MDLAEKLEKRSMLIWCNLSFTSPKACAALSSILIAALFGAEEHHVYSLIGKSLN